MVVSSTFFYPLLDYHVLQVLIWSKYPFVMERHRHRYINVLHHMSYIWNTASNLTSNSVTSSKWSLYIILELITPSSWRVGQQLIKKSLPRMSDSPPSKEKPTPHGMFTYNFISIYYIINKAKFQYVITVVYKYPGFRNDKQCISLYCLTLNICLN